MQKIRVMMADDSAVVRHLVAETLGQSGDCELTAAACSGRQALEMLPGLNPDLILLDVEMPELDGIETVKRIRELDTTIPIIMFSGISSHSASATMEALEAGASDWISKPTKLADRQQVVSWLNDQLLPRIRIVGRKRRPEQPSRTNVVQPQRHSHLPLSVKAIGIGASTGGPNALMKILESLPSRFPVPILVAQHLPALFTQLLADRLDATCPFPVLEASDGQRLNAGSVYFAPGGRHLTAQRVDGELVAKIDRRTDGEIYYPSIDRLFTSLAETYGPRALGIVLTGMGSDGLAGSREIVARKGKVIAQDQQSSIVWGMPKAVSEAGLASAVLPLQRIAPAITRALNNSPSLLA
ncbi:MAG: chemotaxis-specific protein-glutamate methyltransferase CheB, partial [Planctomycetota bacterium]